MIDLFKNWKSPELPTLEELVYNGHIIRKQVCDSAIVYTVDQIWFHFGSLEAAKISADEIDLNKEDK